MMLDPAVNSNQQQHSRPGIQIEKARNHVVLVRGLLLDFLRICWQTQLDRFLEVLQHIGSC